MKQIQSELLNLVAGLHRPAGASGGKQVNAERKAVGRGFVMEWIAMAEEKTWGVTSASAP